MLRHEYRSREDKPASSMAASAAEYKPNLVGGSSYIIPWYSPLAILTALTLRAVFRLALRQTEGLIGSIIHLLGLALAVPDHTTLSRRAATLEVPRPQPRRDGEPMHLLVDSTGLKLCGAGEAGQGSARIASGIPAEGSS